MHLRTRNKTPEEIVAMFGGSAFAEDGIRIGIDEVKSAL
jgi:hypothetical protein